jgi:type VI secretion system protein ImpB
MSVDLRFKSIEDFHPDSVVQQVEPLRKLVSARQRLSDLLSKMDGNDKLESILNEIASDTNAQAQLSSSLGLDKPSGEAPTKEESNG